MNNSRGSKRWRVLGWLSGSGLVAATGAIHLDLYLTGYRSIPTIGWLFLLQVIPLSASPCSCRDAQPFVAAGRAGFSVSTLGGYLLSLWIGLFNFKETRTTAGIVAGLIEVAAFALLAVVAIQPPSRPEPSSASSPRPRTGRLPSMVRRLEVAIAATSLVAVTLLGIAVASVGGAGPASRGGQTELMTAQLPGTKALTNNKGLTLYWSAPDGPSKSRCYGSCAAYWPPVIGTPTAGPGVTGQLGTTRRSDGSIQATYDRHPLYTYIGDSAPGPSQRQRARPEWRLVARSHRLRRDVRAIAGGVPARYLHRRKVTALELHLCTNGAEFLPDRTAYHGSTPQSGLPITIHFDNRPLFNGPCRKSSNVLSTHRLSRPSPAPNRC